MALYTFDR